MGQSVGKERKRILKRLGQRATWALEISAAARNAGSAVQAAQMWAVAGSPGWMHWRVGILLTVGAGSVGRDDGSVKGK